MFTAIFRVGFAGALALSVLAAPALAGDIIVVPTPEDGILTIQDGVDAAVPGDTVKVKRGKYVETVEVFKDGITLMGSRTVIDSEYEGANFHVRGDDVVIMKFQLINGTYGVLGLGNRLEVSKNLIHASREDGVAIEGRDARVYQNKIWGAGGNGINIGDVGQGCCCCLADGCDEGDGCCCCNEDGQSCDAGDGCCADGGDGCCGDGGCCSSADGCCDAGGDGCCCAGDGCVADQDGDIVKGGGAPSHAYVARNYISLCRRSGIRVYDDEMEINRNTVEKCEYGIHGETRFFIGQFFPFSSIFDNKVSNNDHAGLFMENFSNGEVRMEKNRAHTNCGQGISIRGFNFVVERNFARMNNLEGFRCEGGNYALIKNDSTGNRGDGYLCLAAFLQCDGDGGCDAEEIPAPPGALGLRVLEHNGAKENGANGIRTFGDRYLVDGNKVTKNCGDGIDLNLFDDDDDGGGGFTPNVVRLNRVDKNLHEGIDNDTRDAVIDDNTSKKNNGLDIAGKGEGNGTAGSFVGNSFDTGGADDFQVLDNDYFPFF